MECEMTDVFANMTSEEAERFMKGNEHPMRKVAAGMVGSRPVVDLGCGRGIDIDKLYTPEQYLGIDCSEELIRIAERDNPRHAFGTCSIFDYLAFDDDNEKPIGVMISVLEHVESLEIAQELYNDARRVCKELIVGWHTPPHYPKTRIIQVKCELNSPIHQNHYAEGTFHGAVRVIPVLGGELWSVRS
jgi:SAM-dependent methyltransferase